MKQIFVLSQFLCICLLTFMGNVIALDIIIIVQLIAFVFGVWSIRSIGQNNWSVYPVPNAESSITRIGPYKIVRHPMYTALILFFLPVALRATDYKSWTVYVILIVTLIFKIRYEEKQIIAKHPEYIDFKLLTTKKIIPYLF